MKPSPSVTVVVSTFNRTDYLENAIFSVFRQTYKNINIIVVNDGLDDISYLKNVFGSLCPLDVINTPHPGSGANVARNIGFKKSTGDLVAFLDDDDIWYRNKLERQVEIILQGYDLVACSFDYLSDNKVSSRMNCPNSQNIILETLLSGNPYCGMSGVIIKNDSITNNIEPFDINLPCGQDWDLFMSLVQHLKLFYSSESLFLYRVNSKHSITTSLTNLTFEHSIGRLASAKKWRSVIGENAYSQRVYKQLFSGFLKKKHKVKLVNFYCNEFGFLRFFHLTANRIFRFLS